MNGKNVVSPDVLVLLREYVGKRPQLKADTTLFGDLCIYGDDAAELMEALHLRFDVDMSRFDFDSHFLPEAYTCVELVFLPFIGVRRLYRRYLSRTTPEKGEGLIPITVGQLTEAVRTKRWPAAWSRHEDNKG